MADLETTELSVDVLEYMSTIQVVRERIAYAHGYQSGLVDSDIVSKEVASVNMQLNNSIRLLKMELEIYIKFSGATLVEKVNKQVNQILEAEAVVKPESVN